MNTRVNHRGIARARARDTEDDCADLTYPICRNWECTWQNGTFNKQA